MLYYGSPQHHVAYCSSIASNARLNPYWLPWSYNIKSGCHFLITRLLKPPSCSDSPYLRDIDWASGQVLSWSTSCHTHCLCPGPPLPPPASVEPLPDLRAVPSFYHYLGTQVLCLPGGSFTTFWDQNGRP